MGCFDVSCGVSNMTIHNGDKAKLLLLIPETSYPNVDSIKDMVELEPETNFVSGNGPMHLYQPFCLPISGEYNDYGSLENIIKDTTVLSLEKYFDITIEQILKIIQSGRNIWDSYAGILDVYGDGLEIERYSEEAKTNIKWLAKAGFVLNEDENWYHPDVLNVVKWEDNKRVKTDMPVAYVSFKIMENVSPKPTTPEFVLVYWDQEKERYSETWAREVSGLCEVFFEHSKQKSWLDDSPGIMLGIKKEYWKRVILLRKLSGMFIDGQLYDKMTKSDTKTKLQDSYIDTHIMEYMGFKFEHFVDKDYKRTNDIGLPALDMDTEKSFVYSYEGIEKYKFAIKSGNYSNAVDILTNKLTPMKGKYTGDYWYFHPKDLAVGIKKLTNIEIDISILDTIHPLQNKFDKMNDFYGKIDTINQLIELENQKTEKDRNIDLMLSRSLWRSEERESRKEIFSYLNHFPLVDEFYKDAITSKNEEFKKEFCEFYDFFGLLWKINKILIPSSHFTQHGSYKPQLSYNKMVQEVLETKYDNSYEREIDEEENIEEDIED